MSEIPTGEQLTLLKWYAVREQHMAASDYRMAMLYREYGNREAAIKFANFAALASKRARVLMGIEGGLKP